jgi:hypothetical protein
MNAHLVWWFLGVLALMCVLTACCMWVWRAGVRRRIK